MTDNDEQWADDHGYQRGLCPRCKRVLWSDTGEFSCPCEKTEEDGDVTCSWCGNWLDPEKLTIYDSSRDYSTVEHNGGNYHAYCLDEYRESLPKYCEVTIMITYAISEADPVKAKRIVAEHDFTITGHEVIMIDNDYDVEEKIEEP